MDQIEKNINTLNNYKSGDNIDFVKLHQHTLKLINDMEKQIYKYEKKINKKCLDNTFKNVNSKLLNDMLKEIDDLTNKIESSNNLKESVKSFIKQKQLIYDLKNELLKKKSSYIV